jgi:hypothetical protein
MLSPSQAGPPIIGSHACKALYQPHVARHIPNSIATLRRRIAAALARTLP